MTKRILSLARYAAIVASLLLLAAPPAFAQGRGRGLGRGRDQSWKCSIFVNCHDARDGRLDGRGPNRTNGVWRNGVFVPRRSTIRYRNRRSIDDYWRRRHLTYGTRYGNERWRRSRVLRNR